MRLGLSCVVNRNRKVGANSPGASGTITFRGGHAPGGDRGGEGGGGKKRGLSCRRNALPLWSQERGEAGVWARFREGKREPEATNPRTLNKMWLSAWVSVLLRISSLSRTWSRQRCWVGLVFLGSSTWSHELNGVFKSVWGLGAFKTANSWVCSVEKWRMICYLTWSICLGRKIYPSPLFIESERVVLLVRMHFSMKNESELSWQGNLP